MARLIKLMLLSVVFLFGMITLISLLIPSQVRISRAINVAARPAVIQKLVGDSTQWRVWHPGFSDSSRFEGIRIIPGKKDSSSWTFALQQGQKTPVWNGFQLHTYPGSDSATLQWYMDFHLRWYPWQKFGSLFYESMYGPLMEQGLTSLRQKSGE